MFVGDGANDAVAIKDADVGVALSSGSVITQESASFVLLEGENGETKM